MNIIGKKMRKIIKKYGEAVVIRFSPEEMKTYNLEIGDILEMTITKVVKFDEGDK